MTVRRRGATLAELAVALALTGVAGIIGAGLLVAAERRTRRDASTDRAEQVVRDVAHVLGPEVAAAAWETLTLRGDTAIEIDAHVGASVVCVASATTLVLPGAVTSGGDPLTVWRQSPGAGDVALAWDTAGKAWRSVAVTAEDEPTNGAGCPAGSPYRSVADSLAHQSVVRLVVSSALPATVGPGAPVRVVRRVRWTLYRASDHRWWLGMRACPAGVCGPVQPVAGPLAAPADSGLRFAVRAEGIVEAIIRAEADGPALPVVATRQWAVRGAPRVP